MPRQTKQGAGRRRAVAEPQEVASAAGSQVLWLETMSCVPGPGAGYVLCNRFRDRWKSLRQMIEGDIQRIRAHSTANYDERTKRLLAVAVEDAEHPLKQAEVLAELIDNLLVSIEDVFGHAQEDAQQAEEKLKKDRSRTSSQ